jgi:hypothetical protein
MAGRLVVLTADPMADGSAAVLGGQTVVMGKLLVVPMACVTVDLSVVQLAG